MSRGYAPIIPALPMQIGVVLAASIPSPPEGYQFLQTSDGEYLLDAESNFILVRI